ncbi:MAG TPA: AraC family transcriptional regulator [Dongiaceae bacterium]|nr:AraC family transcriptional regulator [Dongiaceae bacterium]
MTKTAAIHVLHSPLERVLRHIEAHLDSPLSVAMLAEIAGLSPFHFSRLFTAQVGESVMSHVRRKRLQHAVRRLSEPEPPDLVQLAFDCGFDSQEAFTRAFKAGLGVSPGRFKRNNAALRDMMETDMTNAARKQPADNLVLLDGVTQRAGFRVAGYRITLEGMPGAEIPEMWGKLLRHMPLPGQVGGEGYGVCWTDDAEKGSMNYMAGFEVAQDAKLPAEFATLDIPAQTYRVFRLTLDGGALGPQIQGAMRDIFANRAPGAGWQLSGGPDLEVYPADFNPTKKGATLDLYVPVKG